MPRWRVLSTFCVKEATPLPSAADCEISASDTRSSNNDTRHLPCPSASVRSMASSVDQTFSGFKLGLACR